MSVCRDHLLLSPALLGHVGLVVLVRLRRRHFRGVVALYQESWSAQNIDWHLLSDLTWRYTVDADTDILPAELGRQKPVQLDCGSPAMCKSAISTGRAALYVLGGIVSKLAALSRLRDTRDGTDVDDVGREIYKAVLTGC